MKSLKIIFFFLLFSEFSFSQEIPDTLNKYDGQYKKQGWWLVYLNDTLISVENKEAASYQVYIYYEEGFSPHNFCGKDQYFKRTASKITREGRTPKKGIPDLIDSTFRFYDGKNKLLFSETFKKGYYVERKEYHYNKQGKCYEKILSDFSKVYSKNYPNSYYVEKYTADDKLINGKYLNLKDTRKKKHKLILSTGVSYSKNLFAEFNVMLSNNPALAHDLTHDLMRGWRMGIECNFSTSHFIYAPKIGYEHVLWDGLLTSRANIINYIDNDKRDYRFLPEFGISCLGFASLSYGYSFPLTGERIPSISNHNIRLILNLDFKYWKETF